LALCFGSYRESDFQSDLVTRDPGFEVLLEVKTFPVRSVLRLEKIRFALNVARRHFVSNTRVDSSVDYLNLAGSKGVMY